MKTRILFVDDEANVLSGLRRMLRNQRKQWEMGFANSGAEALEMMANEPFDVVVSDMRMPGIDGAELLTRISRLYPNTVRLVLSGQSEHEKIFRAIGPAHQFLSKPCEPESLIRTIQLACGLQSHLVDESLCSAISRIDCLPGLPKIYRDLLHELESDDASLDRVAEMISSDLGMTSKILQLVNSSFFGIPQHVSSPKHAVSLLGLNIIRPLALSAGTFLQYEDLGVPGFSLDEMVDHSLAVATSARAIAESETSDHYAIDDAFIAGMMHDIGKLILAVNLSEQYAEALCIADEKAIPLWQAETEVFGTSHGRVGAHLLGLWGLPNPIVEAVAFHHEPNLTSNTEFSPLTAVYAANVLLGHRTANGEPSTDFQWNEDYLKSTGLSDRASKWADQVLSEPVG